MDLIVSEKAIAGENIAQLLADGKVKTKIVSGAKVFEFSWKGKDIQLVPLRGHISDVSYPKEYANWRGVDVRDLINQKIIVYEESEKAIIDALKQLAFDADSIIIATDADREGESIGLEAITYAQQSNKKIKISRAYFSAIAKQDIDKAFSELEKFDYNFAFSANARREIDLIWGAVLTRFISIVSGQIGKEFLSVGRVQSPVLALIVDREKERLAFVSKKYWEIVAFCEKDKIEFQAMHQEEKFWDKEKALSVFNKQPKKAIVRKVEKKVRVLKKPVPFNTTEFIRAATAIGFSAGRAMDLAETLYQKGFTSYPRTDNSTYPASLNLKEILNKLASVRAIMDDVQKVLKLKEIVPSAGKLAKDHPPIYPVTPVQKEALQPDEWKIYELICRRFLATLAEDARTENTSALLDADNEFYVAKGQIVLHAGWKEVYPYSSLNETILPKLDIGDVVKINKLEMSEKETQPPGRYSQGSLIKLMEELGLGTKCLLPDSKILVSTGAEVEQRSISSVFDALQKEKIGKIEVAVNNDFSCFSLDCKAVISQQFAFVSRRKTGKGEKIVEVKFNDGSLLRCTAEHPVLIHDNGTLVFSPAGELKPDTEIAAACFFDSVEQQDFKWENLLQELSVKDKIYGVDCSEDVKSFMNKNGLSQYTMASIVGVKQPQVSERLSAGKIPLVMLSKIGVLPQTVCGVGSPVQARIFGVRFSSAFARILANLVCDGSVDLTKINNEGCFDFRYHNTNLDLIQRFVEDMRTVFGVTLKICVAKRAERISEYYYVRVPAIIGKVLALEFPQLLSKDVSKIPEKFFADFLGAYFDDEGCIEKDSQKLFFSNMNHEALKELAKMLHLLGIGSCLSEKQHKLFVYGIRNVSLFLEKIPIHSVEKKQRLIKVLSEKYLYSGMKCPLLLFEKSILLELAVSRTTAWLATKFGVSETAIIRRISSLRKRGFVKKIVEGNNVQRTRTIKYSAGNFSSSFYALLGEKVLAPNIVSKTVSSRGVLEYDGFVYDISTNSPAPNFILSNKIVVHNSTRPAIIQKLYSRKYIIGNKSLEPSKVAFAVIGSLEKHSEIVTKPQMTAELEKEMDEIAAGKKTQKEVVQKSCDGLSQVMELLFKNKDAVGLELRMALRFSEIFGKCTCGANLVLRKSKIGKRFVGCSAYPDCTVTFPLPQTGFITPTSDYCPECRAPIIQVKAKRFHYKMCLNMTCVTKAEWAKKKEEKLKKEAEKKIVEEEKLKKAGEKGEDVKEKAVVQEGVEETDKELIPNVPVKESAAQALTEAITSIEPVSVKKVKDKLSLKKIKSTKTKSAKSKPSVSSSNTVKVKSK